MEVQIGQSNAAKQQSKQPFLCQNKNVFSTQFYKI